MDSSGPNSHKSFKTTGVIDAPNTWSKTEPNISAKNMASKTKRNRVASRNLSTF
jgi:hypothetical protein